MTTKRPPFQLELDLPILGRGETLDPIAREAEVVTAGFEPEGPASTDHLMEAICDADNIEAALRAVVRNKGAPGVDGLTVRQLPGILKARWPEIEDQLLQGRYQPQPVRRVQIPKPAGGTRDLGIPTVIDRVIRKRCCSGFSRCGTRHSASTATAFGRAAPPTRRWHRRKPMSPKAISSLSI